jgi:transcriptional regulator with XRE-family HTH domain
MTGHELKALRKRQGLSRRALASLAGLHPDTLKYWEGKPQVNMWGHAPDLLFKALGVGQLSQKHVYPAWCHLGNFRASTRPRGGVLLNIPSQWRGHASGDHRPSSSAHAAICKSVAA